MTAKFQTYSDTRGKWISHTRTVERTETLPNGGKVIHFTNGQALTYGLCCELYGKDLGNRGARLPRRNRIATTTEPEVKP